jgi:capsular exopolysaccharide synthesis family protein
MSRIYEALQKAEMEREQSPLPPPEAMEQPMLPTAVVDFDDTVAAEPVEGRFTKLVPEEAFVESDDLPVEKAVPAFDTITPHPWNLSATKLPSLLDRGPAVEQFRSLRSRLYEVRATRPIKSVLISSGLPQEGKSFISTNLAISFARHRNSRVLLIDGDMRRYTVHEMLGTTPSPGLADYLAGKATVEEILQRGEMPAAGTGLPSGRIVLGNLAFIPGGNGGDKAADLSGSPRFPELLAAVGPMFDWIIIDSSPVIPVSDAVNLARSCDGVMLVARGGVTKYPTAQRAATEMRSVNLLGFVLNAVLKAPHVGHYYGYDSGTA